MNVETYSKLSNYSGFIPANNVLPKSRLFSRYASFGTAAIISLLPLSSKAQQEAEVTRNPNSSEQIPVTAKKQLGEMFAKLRLDVEKSPANKQILIKAFLETAFDSSQGICLAESLKKEDVKLYQSMLDGVLRLAEQDGVIKAEITRLSSLKRTSSSSLIPVSTVATKKESSLPTTRLGSASPFSELLVPQRDLDFTKIPHCMQPKTKPWCAVASAITISQVFHGFDLSNNLEVMEDSARLLKLSLFEGRSGGSVGMTLAQQGIDWKGHDPAFKKVLSSDLEAIKYAEKTLLTEVRETLKNGNLVSLTMANMYAADHAIVLLGYSDKEAKFYVSNPVTNKVTLIPASELALKWSDRRKSSDGFFGGSHILRWYSVDCSSAFQVKSNLSGGYLKAIPSSAEVILDEQCKAFISSNINLASNNVLTFEMKKVITDSNFRVRWLAGNWEIGTELECIKGLRSVIKLSLSSSQRKQEQGLGCDAFMVIIPEGDKVQAVAVTGFKTIKEDLQYQVVSKSGTTWMKEHDLYKLMLQCTNQSKHRPSGATCGYYQMPPATDEIVLNRDATTVKVQVHGSLVGHSR